MIWEPQGPQAARRPQRQDALIRRFRIPDSLLPGSLSLSQLRGGKPSWHCAQGDASGHPVWRLTFRVEGREHVQPISQGWVAEVGQRVEAGREFQDAVREVLAAHPPWLRWARKQQEHCRR